MRERTLLIVDGVCGVGCVLEHVPEKVRLAR